MKRYLLLSIIYAATIYGQTLPITGNVKADRVGVEGYFSIVELRTENKAPRFKSQLFLTANLEKLYGGYYTNQVNDIKIFDNNENRELEVTEFDIIGGLKDSLVTETIDTINISFTYFLSQKLIDTLSLNIRFYFLSRLRSFDIKVNLDDELKSVIYLNSNMAVIEELLEEQNYENLLEYIERYNNAYINGFFTDVVYSIIKGDLLNNFDFETIENINKFTARLWYFISDSELYKANSDFRDSSSNLFNINKASLYNLFLSKKASNLSIKEKYELSKQILDLCPNCTGYQDQYYKYAAEYFYQSGDFVSALKHYIEFSIKSPRILERIQECVLVLVKQYFDSNDYSSVENMASEYPEIIENDFAASYYIAESSFKLKNYSVSLKLYLELVNKWNSSNSLLTLSQARDKIQILYTYVGKFDEAIRFNVQAYNTTNDEKYISNVILNTRLKYLIPLQNFVSQINTLQVRQVPTSIIPFYIKKLVNNETGENIVFTESIPNELPIESIPSDIPFSIYNTSKFLSSSNSIIDVDFTNQVSFSSNVIVEEIRKNPSSVANWRELITREENQNRKMFLELLGYIIEKSCTAESFINLLNNKASAISKIDGYKYMVYFNEEKEIVFNNSYNQKIIQRNEEDWNKSLSTNAYYVQVINYNKEVVEDLTVPIYMSKFFHGVLKIGLDKNGVL